MHLSFVLPCLNEERTLGGCILEIQRAFTGRPSLTYEILVADNGSEDKSREIALAHGARVVPVQERGYGSAVRHGIEASQGEHVMFADADGTYCLDDSLRLYDTANQTGADMVIASRLRGRIAPRAMPFLHRWLGTPVLTFLINRMFHGHISDANSGFRCIRRTTYQGWRVCANGMEFASELIVKALKAGAKIIEIPSGLREAPCSRQPHLHTWRDGMRHLLFILSERPGLFERSGLWLVLFASLFQVLALLLGPISLGGLHVFDTHSKALLLLIALSGAQLYLFACVLFLRGRETPSGITRAFLQIDEAKLLLLVLAVLGLEVGIVGAVVAGWAAKGFSDLHAMHWLFGAIHFLSVPAMWIIGLLGIHIFRHTCDRELASSL